MVTTPPEDSQDPDQPPQRWTGRASVSVPPPSVAPPAAPVVAHAPPPGYPAPAYRARRFRPRWGRIALVTFAVLLLVAGIGVLVGYTWISGVNDDLRRTDPFADVAGRPQKLADGTLNILLLGTDSRNPDAPIDQAGRWRTDTIVLMHIPADHEKAYMISFPRDLWVHVPESKDGQYGNTMAKINAAYAWGGAPLMVQTVEQYTGVRIDHVVLLDFGGFIKVTDAVGGVDMNVERTITSIHKPYRKFNKGMHHFNGAEALDYIRQRYQFPDGDFTRMKNQHMFLKALLDKAVSLGTVTNIFAFKNFVTSVADAIVVDQEFSLIDLGWQFRSLRSQDLIFMTSPYSGTGNINGESVVLSDREKALSLYDAVAKDTVDAWYAQNNKASGTTGE